MKDLEVFVFRGSLDCTGNKEMGDQLFKEITSVS